MYISKPITVESMKLKLNISIIFITNKKDSLVDLKFKYFMHVFIWT